MRTNYGRDEFEPGDRVLIREGIARGEVATIANVYCRHWGIQSCYCSVDTDQGVHHFEHGSNLELLGSVTLVAEGGEG